jgi:hypothetical protein
MNRWCPLSQTTRIHVADFVRLFQRESSPQPSIDNTDPCVPGLSRMTWPHLFRLKLFTRTMMS